MRDANKPRNGLNLVAQWPLPAQRKEARRAHTQDHSVPSCVKGKAASSTFSLVVAAPWPVGANPFGQYIVGDIICTHNHYAFAAAQTDPVGCHRNRLGGARTRSIGLVGTLRTDMLCELREWPMLKNLKQEPAVKTTLTIIPTGRNVTRELVVARKGRARRVNAGTHLWRLSGRCTAPLRVV